jgi:glutamate---cysteine ligase / carboxylate-amine ligase
VILDVAGRIRPFFAAPFAPTAGSQFSDDDGEEMPHAYRFGIEEEYFIVDAASKTVAREMPEAFLADAKQATGGRVHGEFLQSQIEAATVPHTCMRAARAELRFLRQTVAAVAAQHGLAIFAAGTHPTALWKRSQQTETERYKIVMDDLQMIGQRNMLCGLHVHVELPDPDDRVDVMCRMLPYLPLFVALATSSPFWQARLTGLKGYRLAAYDELPRTGVPELFRRREDYEAYVAALVRAGVMEDSSFIWWAIRPSLKHPTLELRAPDSCTRADDSLALAALYRAIARALTRNPWLNWDLTAVDRAIVVENKWRAQRYGIAGTFVDIGGNGAISVAEMLEQVIAQVREDAEALDCVDEVMHCREIVGAGTSADAQLAVFEAAQERNDNRSDALRAVTDWIAQATLQ